MVSFTKNDTLFIKGLTIIMLVSNHVYGMPEWIYDQNKYFGLSIGMRTISSYFGGFSKICVAVFAFLTGIAMFYMYSVKTRNAYKHSLKRLIPLMSTYWFVLIFIYIPIMYLTNTLYFDIRDFVLNFFVLRTDYIPVAWYLRFYLQIVFTFPLIDYIIGALSHILADKLNSVFKTQIALFELFILTVVVFMLRFLIIQFSSGIFTSYLSEYLEFLPIVLSGYILTKYDLIVSIMRPTHDYFIKRKILFIPVGLTIFLCVFACRGIFKSVYNFNLDYI